MSKPQHDRLIDIPDNIIKKVLTQSEIRMVKQRLLIIDLLNDNLSVRAIAERVGVGTDTVVRVARMAEGNGLRQSPKKAKGAKPKTSWIFGKSE